MINSKLSKSMLIDNIISIMWPDFVQTKKGLIFLRKNYVEINSEEDTKLIEASTDKGFYFDKTDEESSRNHIHLEEEIPIKSKEKLSHIGKIIGEAWSIKLMYEFPSHHFRVYLNLKNTVTIRFHQLHENEPEWLNEIDWLDEIKLGMIYIWKV